MDSNDLLDSGFSEIEDPKNWSKLPQESRIYAFYVSEALERLEGKTDIIYIGETSNIQRRMREYFKPNGWIKDRGTGHRINSKIQRYDGEITVVTKQVSGSSKDREEEQKLIRAFLNDHHELPAWNRSMNKEYFPWA